MRVLEETVQTAGCSSIRPDKQPAQTALQRKFEASRGSDCHMCGARLASDDPWVHSCGVTLQTRSDQFASLRSQLTE